ncbi:unnamed protein product [Adineta steineri]|uniref:Uncharacterized protein n=1 Tax=Adineta steineri TaxID=433720 RepID=A0A818PHC6_9BILA|nr:unnamed protein product [Adineta steineri]CAF3625022.1 unnamed protein product [Adineta steineri]
MVSILRLSERRSHEGRDNFFLWSMVILPFLAAGAYIFDAFYYFTHRSDHNAYEGLISTILIVFTYLRYCSPIECRLSLCIYYVFLCLLSEIGTIGYIITFIFKKDPFFIIVYCLWGFIELIMTIMLIYCRIIMRYPINFIVENKHLFHFMSRLEIILAIFLPFFISTNYTTLTTDSIAFFLLFDFFSESYTRFQGIWIKSILYVFVATVTASVATEWLYFVQKEHYFEQISAVTELISAVLCNLLIILQFFPYHFTPMNIFKIAREGFVFQRCSNLTTVEKNENESINVETIEKNDVVIDSIC